MSKEKKVIKKKFIGEVVKISGTNTISVKVETRYSHPIYEKIIKKHSKFLADIDLEKNKVEIGDMVMIESTRPISKRKTWKFIEKIK